MTKLYDLQEINTHPPYKRKLFNGPPNQKRPDPQPHNKTGKTHYEDPTDFITELWAQVIHDDSTDSKNTDNTPQTHTETTGQPHTKGNQTLPAYNSKNTWDQQIFFTASSSMDDTNQNNATDTIFRTSSQQMTSQKIKEKDIIAITKEKVRKTTKTVSKYVIKGMNKLSQMKCIPAALRVLFWTLILTPLTWDNKQTKLTSNTTNSTPLTLNTTKKTPLQTFRHRTKVHYHPPTHKLNPG